MEFKYFIYLLQTSLTMKTAKRSLRSLPAMISSIVWGCLGLCLAVAEHIYAINHVHILSNSMDIVIIVMCAGLSFIVSVFLQWHKKKAVKIATNTYLLLVSLYFRFRHACYRPLSAIVP